MVNLGIIRVIARPAGPWRSTKRLDRFAALAMTISLSCQRALGWHPEKNWIRRSSRRMTVLIFFLINPAFATTSHNIYDAKGNLMASCGEKGCEYFIYQGVSRTGVVKNNQFTHQVNGLDGKAGEMVRDQTGIINSQLWIPDFHGSVIAKYAAEKSDRILFDAFGQVLNESTNTEDCEDYHYTDKPRVGCTSLHNFNARFYDPQIGRFITTDPIEQHNLNWFAYANNNPLSFVDSDGRQWKQHAAKGAKVAIDKVIALYFASKLLIQAGKNKDALTQKSNATTGHADGVAGYRYLENQIEQDAVTRAMDEHFSLMGEWEDSAHAALITQFIRNELSNLTSYLPGQNFLNLYAIRHYYQQYLENSSAQITDQGGNSIVIVNGVVSSGHHRLIGYLMAYGTLYGLQGIEEITVGDGSVAAAYEYFEAQQVAAYEQSQQEGYSLFNTIPRHYRITATWDNVHNLFWRTDSSLSPPQNE